MMQPQEDSVHPQSLRLDRNPLDIFTCLWIKNSKTKSSDVYIPDTITFQDGALQQWYFTSKSGEILRRKKDNATKQKLLRFFQDTGTSTLVAVYVHMESNRRVMMVEHLTLEGIEVLLNDPKRTSHGILQKFIPPKSCYNSMIQTSYAHDGCSFEAIRSTNSHMFINQLIPVEQRAVTFERPSSSYNKTISNPSTIKTLVGLNRDVLYHIESIIGMSITRQVLYFKVGNDDRLYFLWPSLIIFENQEEIIPCQLFAPSTFQAVTDPPPQNSPECPSCHSTTKSTSTSVSFLITYKSIIAANQINQSNHDNNEQRGDDEQCLIPSLIQRVYGPMNSEKFRALIKDSSFLYRTVQVCEECCKQLNAQANLHDRQTKPPVKNTRPKSSLGRSFRWRSWKENGRQTLHSAGATRSQSTRYVITRESNLESHKAREPPPIQTTPSRRNSLRGPSLLLVQTDQNNPPPTEKDLGFFRSKPRPVSAACVVPTPRLGSKSNNIVIPDKDSSARKQSQVNVTLAALRSLIRTAAASTNPSLRNLLAQNNAEPQHSTLTLHELFTLCYQVGVPVTILDIKTIALVCEPNDNMNMINIEALDSMLCQANSLDPRHSRPAVRPKSCSSVSKSMPIPRQADIQVPPSYASIRPKSLFSSRNLIAPSPKADNSIGFTDEEAACLFQVLKG